ncbi:MAG: TFIIB-type zinc ribbon-containing protein [Candidatus Bathyarchaeota archaeon]|jgi:transcription initiation factor TFIIB
MSENTGRERCPQCGSFRSVYDLKNGERVCGKCGLIIRDTFVDPRPERRIYNLEEQRKRKRFGIPTNFCYYDKGLFTSFSPNRDPKGRLLGHSKRQKMWRLKRQDNRSKLDESRMRNLSKAMNELSRMADNLHLPDTVKERAAVIYRKALKKDLIKGRTIATIVAASIYAACRLAGVARTLKEVGEVSPYKWKDVASDYRLLLKELNLKMPVPYPMKFIPQIAAKLDVSRGTDGLSVEILREAKDQKALVGKDPMGMAAAALYLACKTNDEKLTQKEIAYAAGTTEVTLRNRLRDLEKVVDRAGLFQETPRVFD